MASSSQKLAAKANLLGKRKLGDDLGTKPVSRKHKEKFEEKETTESFADSLQQTKGWVELSETKSDQANLISVKEAALSKKTLYITPLSLKTEISDIILFFSNAGQVQRVQLIVNRKGEQTGSGYVEFVSAIEAKKALEKKNGQYLGAYKIFLDVPKIASYPPMYCIDHKVVCYEDYLQRDSLLIGEDEPVEGLVEEVASRKKTIFVSNLSPQTKISHIYALFNFDGGVISVRLIVNNEGKRVGCCFVEFSSAYGAKKALEKKNGVYLHDHKIFIDVAKMAPYPPRPKYNLAEKLCYEDYLLRESFLMEEVETVEGLDEHGDFVEEVSAIKKTIFVGHLACRTEISDIINFFNCVGEVVSVRLVVSRKGEHFAYGFVEFASANEAKKALEKTNGGYLCGHKIVVDVAEIASYPPKYCIDHKVWYEDYLQREGLLIEEDETVEGLVEEVAARKKTCFFANLPPQTEISDIKKFFQKVGEVVSVRLSVNRRGEHLRCGFVEFTSANEAKKALSMKTGTMKNGHMIFVDVAKIALYPLRPKYKLAEKLWYEDYLQREGHLIEEDNLETKPILTFCGRKTTFVYDEVDNEVDDEEDFC